MSEAAFPVLGTALVLLLILPAFALLAKVGLSWLERREPAGPLHGLDLRYLLLTGSSFLPLAWLLSAGLHQAETGSALACLFDHGAASLCFEPGFFAFALGLTALSLALPVVRLQRGAVASMSESARALEARLEVLAGAHPGLAELRGRLCVASADDFAIGTHGLLAPRVFVGERFAASLSDEMLASALGHEWQHVRARDPLRYLLLQLALAINPLGRVLLAPHAARWQAVREAHCDREAVLDGAAPLSLADAILRAARPSPREAVALGARDTTVLKFRVDLLLAFAERAPVRCCHRSTDALPVACLLLVLVLFLPHQTGTEALDLLHVGTEQALTYVWR